MAAKKFTIPSLSEMESSKSQEYQAKTLFDKHKQSSKSNSELLADRTIDQETSSNTSNVSKSIPSRMLTQNVPGQPAIKKVNQTDSHLRDASGDMSKNSQPPKQSEPDKTSVKQSAGISQTRVYTGDNSVQSNIKRATASTSSPIRTSSTGIHLTTGFSPSRAVKTYSLLVNTRQRGNPLLKHVRNVPWEFGDIVADYEMGSVMCALFLSLRYHNLNPNYIHERLKLLGQSYDLRVLLVQVDTKDPHYALKELARICLLADCTLILAWTPEEAARYLETYKAFEKKPPDMIMEKQEVDYVSRIQDVLTSGRKVNRTDALTLLSTFGDFENIVRASEEELSFCPGLGVHKAKRLRSLLNEPFLKAKKRVKLNEDEPIN